MTKALQVVVATLCVASCGGGDGSAGGAASGPPIRVAIGGSVTGLRGTGLVLENNSGDPLTIAANGSFTLPTPLPNGAAYIVTVRTQPTASPAEDCSVANGSGVVGRVAVSNVTVSCRAATTGKYLYTLYNVPGGLYLLPKISGFSIDRSTGALTEIPGSPFAVKTGDIDVGIGLHTSGKFLYITGRGVEINGSLTGYAIDSATGALTLIPGMPIARVILGAPFSHPSGRALYVSMGGLRAYSIDQTSGAIAQLAGSPYSFGDGYNLAGSPVFNQAGTIVFVPFSGGEPRRGGVSAFAVDPTTGAWTFQGGTDRLLSGFGEIVLHPGGKYAYMRSYNQISVLGVENPASISVAEMPVPPDRGTFNGTGSIFNDTGQYVYFRSSGTVNGPPSVPGPTTIFAYRVDTVSGALTPVAGSPYPINEGGGFTMDPTRRFIVVNNSTVGVAVFKSDASTGELTHAPESPFTPTVGTTPLQVIFEPSGKFAYMPDGPSLSVSAYSFDSTNGRFAFVGSYPLPARPIVTVVAGLQ